MLPIQTPLLPTARPTFQSGYARNMSQAQHPNLWQALVGAWCPSVGMQGRRLEDFSGRGNHGTFSTGMTLSAWIMTRWGYALQYDGTDDCVGLPVGLVSLNTDFTIAVRCAPDDITHNTYSLVGASVGGDGTQSYFIFIHRTDKSGMVFQYDTGPGTGSFCTSPSSNLVAATWSHMVLARSQSRSTFAVYQDGKSIINDGTNPSFSNPITGTWGIGSWDPINVTNLWKGLIGDVFLWNRGLLGREMTSLYEGNSPLQLREQVGFGYSIPLTAPTVTTTAASSITTTTASSGGNVTSDGNRAVTARGVCWSTSSNPTTADSHTTDGTGTGSFSSSLTGLTASTLYHIRAYATNAIGTSYGSDLTFTTSALSSSSGNMLLLGVGG